jgi:tetratricopeptide (TPR) repeat protein
MEPENLLVANSYSYALVSLGELEKALPIYEKNYSENTDNPVQARNYAEILFLAKRWDDCTAHIARMREQFGDAEELSDLSDLEKRIEAAIEREKKEAEKETEGEADDSGVIDETDETEEVDTTGEGDSSEPGETGETAETTDTDTTDTDGESVESE